ncbi:hypothetical protein [Acinetobacter tianfuensis]|uniref:Uncharacterized protein n=1 Tax=Acinetobacter tianfuensis TaxID=2419603 RepID=A0A3A8EK67_9GAMM|nr:hypothetical protein [Acinetobacter tianfuensis]RKG34509.1 hypothetical protein D7V32_00035 [Acinetobacter tianfuensis]
MFKQALLPLLICVSSVTQAGLVGLDNTELVGITGQGGADLNWTLSLNHQYASDLSLASISKTNGTVNGGDFANVTEAYYKIRPGTDCALLELCRLAISPNNHTENGQKKWLVFKQIQGTLQIDKFSLEGTTLINKDGNPQTAMMLKFYDDKPLKIRNLGFASLAVESGDTGYLNNTKYGTYGASQAVPSFDNGQEQGFMGLNVHGNLHMSGDLKIFSYNCSGAAGARC